MRSSKGWWAFGLASTGVLWTAALIPGAFFFPAYSGDSSSSSGTTLHTTNTLVGVNGLWIVTPFVLFLVLSVAAWLGLHASCSTGSRRARMLGQGAAALLAVAAVLTFSAGFLALPAAVLVVVAAAVTPAPQAREM
jgi:hypothetical protein